ncbi:hypothetical protein OPV22_015592 [Ensete ventricosum]|uniref:Uncharacterized protein n=1 Tax=Ensete ventricosum TaxID=4639 RepID=A0AAV8R9U0_ENSVE|nr:hypothetical protein OPV22_015592 [Ensete ventricosum]
MSCHVSLVGDLTPALGGYLIQLYPKRTARFCSFVPPLLLPCFGPAVNDKASVDHVGDEWDPPAERADPPIIRKVEVKLKRLIVLTSVLSGSGVHTPQYSGRRRSASPAHSSFTHQICLLFATREGLSDSVKEDTTRKSSSILFKERSGF